MTLITCKIYRYTTKNTKIILDDPKLEDSQSNRLGVNKFNIDLKFVHNLSLNNFIYLDNLTILSLKRVPKNN